MEMSEKIKMIRKSLPTKHSQDLFGHKIGVSRDIINNFENNRSEPTEAHMLLICQVYHVNYDWLSGQDENAPMFTQPGENDRVLDLLSGDNAFAKHTLRTLAALSPEEWALLKKLVDRLSETP